MSKELCRICLEALHLHYIFEETCDSEYATIVDKIKEISGIEIGLSDDLPPFVCTDCLQKIDNFVIFKSQIKSSQEYLQTLEWDSTKAELEIETLDSLPDQDVDASTKEPCETYGGKQIRDNFTQDNSELLEESEENESLNEDEIKTTTKRKQAQCTICGKLLSTKSRLKCHLRIHTGEKPYKCDKCDKSFAECNNLKVHRRIHTGEKPLECKFCGRRFNQGTSLTSHMRLHTGECPYECHICGKRFKTKSPVKYHIRLHTGEKSFACDICDKAFITTNDLKQHIKTHTGERPYECSVCEKKFATTSHLKRHLKIHTRDKSGGSEIKIIKRKSKNA